MWLAVTIRFKGFTDTWEQRKLGDMCDEFQSGKSIKASDITDSGEYAVYGGNGFRGYTDTYNHDGDYALIGRQGALCGNMNFSSGKAYFTEHAIAVHGNADNDTLFLYYLLDLMNLGQYSGQSAQPGLAVNKIIQLKTKAPKLDEQRLISSFFKQLDSLITLHQRKYDKLIQFKAAMLQKMFPQNGADKPEIRFKGFTDAWEQRKLGDIGKARSGVGFPDAEQGGVTGIPFFKVSDMNLGGNESEMTVANNYVTAEQIAVHRWSPITELPAIFFAKVGAAVMLNRKRLCRFPFLLDNNTMAYSLSSTKWDADFAKALFGTVDLTSLVQVGALPSYNAGDVESMEIYLPSLLEQEQIGGFFKQLDNLITLHQRKCDKYKSIKSGLIRKLFP